ncbi:cupin domain-containing protein [Microvirga massiliensis]|jgi:quercetin dioxygenase-like cupin family protein|uniref:cupin domain-containing protein n=1 Tax=Microvirga massiliensis TaxID=1033741 RepID=UPI00062B9533|nr:cupin domain-containing protein [Microvirga massiliensis]
MDVRKIDWNAIPWKEIRPGVEQKAFSGEGATVALHRLAPGHEPKPHSHPNEQIAYIIAGTMRFHVGDESHLLGPGGVLVVPPNVVHWGEVVGDEPVLNLDVFTPRRPEYA